MFLIWNNKHFSLFLKGIYCLLKQIFLEDESPTLIQLKLKTYFASLLLVFGWAFENIYQFSGIYPVLVFVLLLTSENFNLYDFGYSLGKKSSSVFLYFTKFHYQWKRTHGLFFWSLRYTVEQAANKNASVKAFFK